MENKHLIGAGIIGLVILLIVLFFFQSNNKTTDTGNPLNFSFKPIESGASPTPPIKELQLQDVTVGTGSAVVVGDVIVVNYAGAFLDGKVFDSSYARKQPFEVKIGAGQVIKGWDQGIIGMQVGGKRKLIIPSDLAYGATGQGSIPPNTPLYFEVELLEIKLKDVSSEASPSPTAGASLTPTPTPESTPSPTPAP